VRIRSFEYEDQQHVVAMMSEHPLQFPTFIIEKYPVRCQSFYNRTEI